MRRVLALSGRRFAGKDTLAELRAAAGWRETPGVDDHPTETALDDPSLWDEVVANDGDLTSLRVRAEARLDAWLAAAGAR